MSAFKKCYSQVFGEGNEKVRETIQVLNGNCGIWDLFICLFWGLSSEESSLSICLICWKTVVAAFYSKKTSLLCLNHKHLASICTSYDTFIVVLWGNLWVWIFYLMRLLHLLPQPLEQAMYYITGYLWDQREQIF